MNPQPVSLADELRGALARGYCHAENSRKVLDSDLIEAMREEVEGLLAQHAVAEPQVASELVERITDYLTKGGLFNPEMMEHDKVRALLIACRQQLFVAAHVAEQPKLTELEALLAEGVGILRGFNPKDYPRTCAWRERAKAALLTSPVAPPPPKLIENADLLALIQKYLPRTTKHFELDELSRLTEALNARTE